MKTSGKKGSNGVYVSDNVERRFETDIHTCVIVKYLKKTASFQHA
jgi:hypothetical protein